MTVDVAKSPTNTLAGIDWLILLIFVPKAFKYLKNSRANILG
jgi:hypothetical protein